MIKNLIALFLLYGLVACNQTENKQSGDLPEAKNDTVEGYYEEQNIPINEGFSVDTIRESDKKTGYSRELILPKLTEPVFNELNKVLANEIKRKAALCYADTTDAPVYSADEVFDVSEVINPLKMYKADKLVSYGFLNMFFEPGMMRPFRKYFTINYDIRKSKFIFFDDYFTIISPSDSAFFKQLVFGNVGNPDVSWYTLSNTINFSVDEENVYFYYDMFGEFEQPIGLVNKFKQKYLNKFIKDEYK